MPSIVDGNQMSLLNGMGSALGDEEEAALSDCEDDDFEPSPVVLPLPTPAVTAHASYLESLKTAIADLENERQARKIAESAKADSDVTVVRLKSYVHEVIRQRDEAIRNRDEAVRAKEDRSKQLDEALHLKEDAIKLRDEIMFQRDEILKQKETARSEIEGVARILVAQNEKITSMANGMKTFSGGLPRVPNSSGLAAIALGFSKRVEEVVEEVLRQREDALKRRNEARLQMEQRNFTIAIEVSQLEASITQMKEEVAKKSSELERCQKLLAGKDSKLAELERTMLDQIGKTKHEAETMKERVQEVESRLHLVSSETAQNIECVGKAKENIMEIFRLIKSENSSTGAEVDLVGSPEIEESAQKGFLAKGQEIVDLAGRLALLWKETILNMENDRRNFESTIKSLEDERNDILTRLSFAENGSVSIENTESRLIDDREKTRKDDLLADESDMSNNDNQDGAVLLTPATNGELSQELSLSSYQAKIASHEKKLEQASLKIVRLEEQLEKVRRELEKTSGSSRLEMDRMQALLTTQTKDVAEKKARILELEKHVASLTSELQAAEEDVTRWKQAATEEAAAGEAVLEEVEVRNKEIAALNKRLGEMREVLEEINSRVGSKEDMAMAAIAARTAAERSLQIADERGADLRYRIEEMSRQLEEFEQRSGNQGYGLLDMCWPWLCGRGRPGRRRAGEDGQRSAEMGELLEPLV